MEKYLDKSSYKFHSYLLDYGILNKDLPFKMNISRNVSQSFMGDDNLTFRLASSEIQQSFERNISQTFHLENEDYIDVLDLKEKDASMKLTDYLISNDFDFVIYSGALSTDISNGYWDTRFNFTPSSGTGANPRSQLYNVGSIQTYGKKIDFYVDPYKKYTDKSILCGKKDGFQYNVEIDTILPKPDLTSFNSRLQILLKFNIDILKQFTTLYFINEKDYAYDKFKSHLIKENRDIKIDEILK